MKIELDIPRGTTRFRLEMEFGYCPLPGTVTNLEISVMSKTLTATYKLPVDTGDSPIDRVDIALSYDGGLTYAPADPPSNAANSDPIQTYSSTVEDNLTHVQFTVVNTSGKVGSPLVAAVTATGTGSPGVVTDVVLTLA